MPAKPAQNTYIGGLNQDISNQKFQNKTYFDAKDIRIVTTEGSSTGAVENIKGNKLSFTIPDVSNVLKCVPLVLPDTTGGTYGSSIGQLGINVNGILMSVDRYDTVTNTGKTAYTVLKELSDLINANTALNASNILSHVVRDDNAIQIYSTDDVTITQTQSGWEDCSYIAKQNDLQIIGWGVVRDDLYVFTTNDKTTTGGAGQIWKLTHDVYTDSYTPTLIYHEKLKFTTLHPIGDECVGRYEQKDIQRLYWSDYFNPVRSINVSDDDVLATPLTIIDLKPAVNAATVSVDSIDDGGGSISSGVYQYSVRLKNSQGALTKYTVPTNGLNVFKTSLTENWADFTGDAGGVNSNKSVNVSVKNIDADFDIIELVAIYKENDGSARVASFIEEYPVTNYNETIIHHSGNENTNFVISADEFFGFTDMDFDIAKSISSKDNRLFLGNVKAPAFDIDFDARAYRFKKGTNDTYTPNPVDINQTSDWGVDKEIDVVNPYNKDSTREKVGQVGPPANADNDYKFQKNSNILGGSGPNVVYRFDIRNILLDDTNQLRNLNETFVDPITQNALDFDINGNTINASGGYDNYANPHIAQNRTGYMRDEVYRFAIVFFDLKFIPSPAKWIADIRMPQQSDTQANGDRFTTYEYNASTDTTTGKILGLSFEVDISSIKDKISGYQIVRAKRDDPNKTIMAQGIIQPTAAVYYKDGNLNNGNEDIIVYPYTTANNAALNLSDALGSNHEALFLANNGIDNEAYQRNSSGIYTGNKFNKVEYSSTSLFSFDSPEFLFRSPSISDFNLKPTSVIKGGYSNVSTIFNNSGNIEEKILNNFSTYSTSNHEDSFGYKKWSNIAKYAPNLVGKSTFSFTTEGYKVLGRADKTSFNSVGATFSSDFNNESDNGSDTSFDGDTFANTSSGSNPTVYNAAHWHMNNKNINDNNSVFSSTGEKTMFISSPETLASYVSIFKTSSTAGSNYGNAAPIVNLYRELNEQYGGATYENRKANLYISTGSFISLTSDYAIEEMANNANKIKTEVWGGDTFVTMFDQIKFQTNFGADEGRDDFYKDDSLNDYRFGYAHVFPVESTINTDMRYNTHFAVNGANGISTSPINSVVADNYSYNGAQSEDNNYRLFVADTDTEILNENDTLIIASEVKINGEKTDAWRIFKGTNQINLEGIYGPINRIKILKDQLYAVQDRAFGLVQVNPQAAISGTGTGDGLIIGQGSVLNDHVYLSTEYGTKHQWSVFASDTALYFFDILRKKMITYVAGKGAAPLSDVKGLHGYFRTNLDGAILDVDHSDSHLLGDNPIENYGINGTYDYKNNEAVMTFHTLDNSVEDSFTVAYSEQAQAFSSFYTATPKIYINDKRNILSPDPTNVDKVYIHDKGDYGVFYDNVPAESYVDIIVNPEPYIAKTFSNVHFLSEVTDTNGDVYDETMDQIHIYNEYQDSGLVTLIPESNIRRFMRSWRLYIPRDGDARIRNPYTHVKLFYKNSSNRKLILHDIITYYNSGSL